MENVKIELIDENKLKAVLSCHDILSLDCDANELFGDTISRKLIDEILKKAYDEVSFSADISKTSIETVLSAKDGYIVFITKTSDTKSTDKKNKTNVIYSFPDYFSLKKGVDGIKNIFSGYSTLFELDGKYYLILNSDFNENFKKTQIILTEYGDHIDNTIIFEAVLLEYGRKLFEKNAVKMINTI